MKKQKQTILFVCVHNSGRSQMAEAFFNQLAQEKAMAISAGTQPADKVNPVVVKAMREVNINISNNKPKLLTMEMVEGADMMITMGCGADADGVCPAGFIESEDWQLDDPRDKDISEVKRIRDEIKNKIVKLVNEITK